MAKSSLALELYLPRVVVCRRLVNSGAIPTLRARSACLPRRMLKPFIILKSPRRLPPSPLKLAASSPSTTSRSRSAPPTGGTTCGSSRPMGQGLAALIALNILEGFDLKQFPRESAESYHLQLETMKLAFVDAQRYISDPERVTIPTRELLSREYAARRRALIGDQALLPEPGEPLAGGTVYLCTADA